MLLIRIFCFASGLLIVIITIRSAIRVFVLPRGEQDQIVRWVFRSIRGIFNLRLDYITSYQDYDRIMAYYAPVSLLALLPVWYGFVLIGYMLLYWGAGVKNWYIAFRDSGSSLLTLGFEPVNTTFFSLLAFTEAIIGLLLVALLIAYLPTMYAAFSRRETLVKLLEVRAGNPPSAVEMLKRYHRIQGMGRLEDEWAKWEAWYADIDESHTSLAALVFFRSPQGIHSWITAAGTILDCASMYLSALDVPFNPQAALCIRSGYLSLQHIAEFFNISYRKKVKQGDPISITRDQFEEALNDLVQAGIPIKEDREQAWLDFTGWRVNYDDVLGSLVELIMAPPAPWIPNPKLDFNSSGTPD